jgi:hypothetical protein
MTALGPTRIIVSAGLALLATTALGASPASAIASSAPITVSVTRNVPGPSGTIGTVTAHCPHGTRVISGGYDSTHSSAAVLPHASMRTGTRSWRVSAYKIGNGKATLTALARCGGGFGPLKTTSERVIVPALPGHIALRTARPQCPGEGFALSGGFKISVNGRDTPNSPPVAVILGSRSVRHSWAVTATRLASTGASRMTAYAYCTSSRPLTRAISGIFPARNRPRRLTALCPWGTAVVSGGFLAHFPMGAARGVMIPITSGPAGRRRWTSTGLPQNANTFFSAFAYCA